MTSEGAPPTDREGVWLFVQNHFELRLPHKRLTRGHSTPLDFVADAFIHPEKDVAAWACRSGLKTLGMSILAAMELAFEGRLNIRVLSGSREQAENLYRYWLRWTRLEMLAWRLTGRPTRWRTQLGPGTLEIVAATERSVRGPKVQRVLRDEIDECRPEVLAASLGMLAGRKDRPARVVDASTWHRADGPMAALVEGAGQSGVALHKWGLWESLEACGPERHDEGRGCDRCPLQEPCRGAAADLDGVTEPRIGVAERCCGLLRIDDAIRNFQRWSRSRWRAEALCERPTVDGLVWPEFDADRHRGRPPEQLIVYRTIDWGCGVFVCLWIGVDRDGWAYVLDTYRAEGATIHQHAAYIGAHAIRDVAATYCDPAGRNRNDQSGRSNVDLFGEYGIACSYRTDRRSRAVARGIALVRAALDPADGPPRLYYADTAANAVFVKAMQSYRNRRVNGMWIDEPADPQPFEHVPDALRYFFVNRETADRKVGVVSLAAR